MRAIQCLLFVILTYIIQECVGKEQKGRKQPDDPESIDISSVVDGLLGGMKENSTLTNSRLREKMVETLSKILSGPDGKMSFSNKNKLSAAKDAIESLKKKQANKAMPRKR
eukprot:Sspe_Gene.62343::Locus_34950_Transcript_1_1_Confidence_1.000_Length_2309::g.62343::m.62343